MDRETTLRQALAALEAEYRIKARPIIDELVKIEASKPPRPIIWTGPRVDCLRYEIINPEETKP